MDVVRVFLGYDPREAVAFHVACHSLHRHASVPVSVAPLMLSQLEGIFQRPRDPRQSTDFAFSRFLVPYLCGYQGWALFADCDVLFCTDLARLWALRDDRFAVQVVKHDHRPTENTKFLGQPQTAYPRKNWSSVVLFNAARCRVLTPDYVASASGLELHRFLWLRDEEIGELPSGWNHLVGYGPEVSEREVFNLHYTNGGPWFADCRGGPMEAPWWDELRNALHPLTPEEAAAARAA